MKRVIGLAAACVCVCGWAAAQGPFVPRVTWAVETEDPRPVRRDLRYGETVDWEVRLRNYGAAMDLTGAAVTLHARTNGMAAGTSFQVAGEARAGGTAWVRVRVAEWLPYGFESGEYTLAVVQTNSARVLRVSGAVVVDRTAAEPEADPVPVSWAAGAVDAAVGAVQGLLDAAIAPMASTQDVAQAIANIPPVVHPPEQDVIALAALETNRVTVWASGDGTRFATIEPGQNYGTLWAVTEAATNTFLAQPSPDASPSIGPNISVWPFVTGSDMPYWGGWFFPSIMFYREDGSGSSTWERELEGWDGSFPVTLLPTYQASGSVTIYRILLVTNAIAYFPTTTNALLNLDDVDSPETWSYSDMTNWMDYGNAGQLWASGLADDAAQSFMNAHTGAADPHPGTYTPLSVGAALTSAVTRIDREKELHADSFTNLIWRNVYSNGWTWLAAYTNTVGGGE